MTRPSTEQHAFFREHGWLVLRGVAAGESLAAATEAFDRATQHTAGHEHVLRDNHGKSVWQVTDVCRQNGALLAHLRHGLGEFAADLLGARRIQLLQDTLIVKPAGAGASIALHQDYAHTGFLEPPNAVSIRLSLTASTAAGGCLYAIDGSHRWGLPPTLSIFSDRLQERIAEQLPPEFRARVDTDRVPIELDPGDVSIHHCLTYHGSFENTGDSIQKTIVTHVFDGACRLAPQHLPAGAIHFFSTDAEGRLNTASFPVMFDQLPIGSHE